MSNPCDDAPSIEALYHLLKPVDPDPAYQVVVYHQDGRRFAGFRDEAHAGWFIRQCGFQETATIRVADNPRRSKVLDKLTAAQKDEIVLEAIKASRWVENQEIACIALEKLKAKIESLSGMELEIYT